MRGIVAAWVAVVLAIAPVKGNGVGIGLDRSHAPYLGELQPPAQDWFESAFQLFKRHFIAPDGRVVDPQNGGISHSEGQGYGLLLALLGGDRETFGRIWRFARDELQRADRLFAWKWVPGQGVADTNNATDGDLLIATALTIAGTRWQDGAYLAEAEAIARAVGRRLIIDHRGYTVLLPGEWAAPSRADPQATLNLSYHIPFALPVMEALAPRYRWEEMMRDGERMLDGLVHPPSDWSSLDDRGRLVPARGFPGQFGYDAVRIPLYLLQDGRTNRVVTGHLLATWKDDDRGDVFAFDVYTSARVAPFSDPAYRFVYELLHCAEFGEPVDHRSMALPMDSYFATSLHLMAIAAMYTHYPRCFPRQQRAATSG